MTSRDRTRCVVRLAWVVAVHLAACGTGAAQVRGLPVDPNDEPPAAQPTRTTRGVSLRRPIALPSGEITPVQYLQPVQGEPISPLVPGVGPTGPAVPFESPLPELQPEPKPPCNDPFAFRTGKGGTVTGLPRTLLWESPFAMPRQPRFMVMPTTLSNSTTDQTLETAIGGTLGLLRVEPANWKTAVQVDAFAVVNSRFSQYDFLVDADFRYGIPITLSRGPWHMKFGYEHTSSHLGDEYAVRSGQAPINYIKDEVVLGLGRWMFDERWRVYTEFAWAASQNIPGDPSPFRADVGAEWVGRRATGCWGKPFAAANVRFDGAVDYDPNFTLQLGWQWRDPTRRLGQARVFGEYYTGYSPYGQFFQRRESWFGFGVSFDF